MAGLKHAAGRLSLGIIAGSLIVAAGQVWASGARRAREHT
jgi:hypothetical protein